MHPFQPICLKQFDLKITAFAKRIWVRHLSLWLYLATQIRWAFHPLSKCAELFCINFIVLSMHTVSKIQISLMLHIIAVVWKQIAGAVVYVSIRDSPAQLTVLEEMHIFSEVLPKIHHTQMRAKLLSMVTEHNRNTDEFLKCLKHCLFYF